MFGAVKSTKNSDCDKYGYCIGFDPHATFSLPENKFGKNVLILGVNDSSLAQVDNRKKYILVLGKGPIDELDITRITAEA